MKSIPCDLPYDPWYKIGAAFKNLGGSYQDFENWSQECSMSDWAGWSGMRLGLPTLLKYSSFYSGATETAVLFREAFGLNPEAFPSPVLKINKQFTELTDITADTKGVLLKSRTGTGKSTLAFEKCRKLLEADPSARILYIVSSRALAWSSTSSTKSGQPTCSTET